MSPGPVEQAFLDDIVAHPEDPSLWLILSDWLTERDDPRADLVRLTWQLQYEPDHADFASRQARVQELLAGGMLPVRPRRTVGTYEFAWIAPGSFIMGSPTTETGRSNDEGRHRVTLTAGFWLAVFHVTQRQWQEVMGDNPSRFTQTGDQRRSLAGLDEADIEQFPVESVSWNSAQDLCGRLSQILGVRVGLPTEAQWEYACRAGTTTPFHFGAIFDGSQANADVVYPTGSERKGPYLARPSVVGSYPPNAWGLYDMHGNLWEWCADAYTVNLAELPTTDPFHAPEGDDQRVVRGGAARAHGYRCRAAARLRYARERGHENVGLRVCLPPA
jgi:uncharacterized protein (TIGR02996 family)